MPNAGEFWLFGTPCACETWRAPRRCGTLQGHTTGVIAVAVTPSRVASGSDDNTLRAWELKDGKELVTFPWECHSVRGTAGDHRCRTYFRPSAFPAVGRRGLITGKSRPDFKIESLRGRPLISSSSLLGYSPLASSFRLRDFVTPVVSLNWPFCVTV